MYSSVAEYIPPRTVRFTYQSVSVASSPAACQISSTRIALCLKLVDIFKGCAYNSVRVRESMSQKPMRKWLTQKVTCMLSAWGHFEMKGACISKRILTSEDTRWLGIRFFKSSFVSIISINFCKQSSMKNWTKQIRTSVKGQYKRLLKGGIYEQNLDIQRSYHIQQTSGIYPPWKKDQIPMNQGEHWN